MSFNIYLGSLIASTVRMHVDVARRLAQASKAFGTLMKMDRNLHLTIKNKVIMPVFCLCCYMVQSAGSL